MVALLASPGAAPTAPVAATRATTIRVKAYEFGFTLSARSAPRGRVTFVVRNTGFGEHSFKINGRATPFIDSTKTVRLTVTFSKAGKYPYRCTFPGHAAAGMTGVFRIR